MDIKGSPGFVRPDANTIWENLLRKGIQVMNTKQVNLKMNVNVE